MDDDAGMDDDRRPTEPGLIATARRLGHHLWVERALFSWLGQWSGAEGIDPRATVFLGEMSARHGWHAELLFARLPELRELEPEGLVVPSSAEARAFLNEVCGAVEPDRLLEALVGYHRVLLPVVLASYRSLLDAASPVADASVARWVGFVVGDDVDEWVRGDELVRSLVVDDATLTRTLDRQREVERLLQGCPEFPG